MKEKSVLQEEDDTLYCEWCGEFPSYISLFESEDSEQETALCKRCYQLDYE